MNSFNIFQMPEGIALNTIGQFWDAYLFIYLVNHFFPPRRGTIVSRKYNAVLAVLFAAILYLVDYFSGNYFYLYYAVIFLLPFLYSLLFFQGELGTKIVICSMLTSLILSFENLFIQFPFPESLSPSTNYYMCVGSFFLQRIVGKFLLYLIIKKLILWPRESKIQLPASCWLILLVISICDNLLLVIWHLPSAAPSVGVQLMALFFLVFMPVFLLIIMKHLAISADRTRVASVQIAQSRMQTQALQQQLDMMESLRKFRHDYKAHLFCMDTLLEAKKYEELHQYLSSLHQYQYEGIHLRRFVDDESLNILLNQKVTLAEKYGIHFETNIAFTDKGKITMGDLNSLIVNLCDNAIEACATLPDAKIRLDIHQAKAYLIIEISNTCRENVTKTNPGFYTSKSNPELHGLGIKIIKSITEKYHGQYQVSSTDHSFTTNLMLLDE